MVAYVSDAGVNQSYPWDAFQESPIKKGVAVGKWYDREKEGNFPTAVFEPQVWQSLSSTLRMTAIHAQESRLDRKFQIRNEAKRRE